MKFLLEDSGFSLKDVLYSSPAPRSLQPVKLPARIGKSSPLYEAFRLYNKNVETLNELLFGMQDYAVIAER